MHLQASAKSRILHFIWRGDKTSNKESVYSLQREAHNGNAQMAFNEKYYINIHLCFYMLMVGILYKILTILIYLCGNTTKHIREILYFTWNPAVFQMGHFYWCMMSALANLISRKLDEVHRLSRHAICIKCIYFFRLIYFNYTDVIFASIVGKNLAHIIGHFG